MVSMRISSSPAQASSWVRSHWATQRMPLPHILPSLPSALKIRMAATAPGVQGAQMQITPSAPTETCRADSRRARASISRGRPPVRQSR